MISVHALDSEALDGTANSVSDIVDTCMSVENVALPFAGHVCFKVIHLHLSARVTRGRAGEIKYRIAISIRALSVDKLQGNNVVVSAPGMESMRVSLRSWCSNPAFPSAIASLCRPDSSSREPSMGISSSSAISSGRIASFLPQAGPLQPEIGDTDSDTDAAPHDEPHVSRYTLETVHRLYVAYDPGGVLVFSIMAAFDSSVIHLLERQGVLLKQASELGDDEFSIDWIWIRWGIRTELTNHVPVPNYDRHVANYVACSKLEACLMRMRSGWSRHAGSVLCQGGPRALDITDLCSVKDILACFVEFRCSFCWWRPMH